MKVSIVIASAAGGNFLFNCLNSLQNQVSDPDIEVIVVDRCNGETAARIEEGYPFVNLVKTSSDQRPSVPELRMIGVKQAKGDVIAIIEEHCRATPDWVQIIRRNFREGDAAIGGPILDDNYPHLTDWVVYFSEYHNYLPAWDEGNRYLLNGVNIAYDRQRLLKHIDVLDQGYWEVVLHPLLAKEGNFKAIPNMDVYHTGPFGYKYYLGQRYLLSRVWGGTQREQVSLTKRIAYLITAPIIPFLLLLRITQRVRASNISFSKFLSAVPLLIPVLIAYVWGEWSGYLVGYGDALERVE